MPCTIVNSWAFHPSRSPSECIPPHENGMPCVVFPTDKITKIIFSERHRHISTSTSSRNRIKMCRIRLVAAFSFESKNRFANDKIGLCVRRARAYVHGPAHARNILSSAHLLVFILFAGVVRNFYHSVCFLECEDAKRTKKNWFRQAAAINLLLLP